jgi:hypothetical protein
MTDLRTEISNIENDLERAYVLERSRVMTDKDGYTKAGMSKSTFYAWPTERREYLNALARRLNTEVALQVMMELQEAAIEAAQVKKKGLKSRNEYVQQNAASEIMDRIVGKPTQRIDQNSNQSGEVIIRIIEVDEDADNND